MTDRAALDAIRARHVPMYPSAPSDAEENHCELDDCTWPCDAAQLLAALDRAEAVVGALRDFDGEMGHSWRCEYRTEESGWKPGEPPVIHCECGYDEIGQALRAYEDADKARAALADVAGEVEG